MPQFIDSHYIDYLDRCLAYNWCPLPWLTWWNSAYYQGCNKPIIPLKGN